MSTLNCDEVAGGRPKLLAYVFHQSESRPPRFKEASTGERERLLPPKNGYFTAIGSCSMKTVADRHTHAAYHNKQ